MYSFSEFPFRSFSLQDLVQKIFGHILSPSSLWQVWGNNRVLWSFVSLMSVTLLRDSTSVSRMNDLEHTGRSSKTLVRYQAGGSQSSLHPAHYRLGPEWSQWEGGNGLHYFSLMKMPCIYYGPETKSELWFWFDSWAWEGLTHSSPKVDCDRAWTGGLPFWISPPPTWGRPRFHLT